MKRILFFCFLLSLVACETKEDKINKAKETIKHLCAWYKNNKKKFDEQLPYYIG